MNNQSNVRTERGTSARPAGRGGIAAKSQEAAEQLEQSITERVGQVRSQADSAKEQAAERVRRVAHQLKSMSETMRSDDPAVASLAERASRSVDNIAQYIGSTDGRAMLRDTEQLARERPALFFGGAFVLGLAAGRFMKSSRPEGYRYRAERRDYDYEYQTERAAREWPTAPSEPEIPRRNEAISSQERFRQNYDAAFGRDTSDIGSASTSASGATTTSPSSPSPSSPSPSSPIPSPSSPSPTSPVTGSTVSGIGIPDTGPLPGTSSPRSSSDTTAGLDDIGSVERGKGSGS